MIYATTRRKLKKENKILKKQTQMNAYSLILFTWSSKAIKTLAKIETMVAHRGWEGQEEGMKGFLGIRKMF